MHARLISTNPTTMIEPKLTLHIEGLVLFIGAALVFAEQGGSWLIFALLLFAPDVSMIGYLKDARTGALTYNLAHSYLIPALLLLIGAASANPTLIQLAAIWFAHIGLDRTLGYGLKYATAFKDTHMQRV